MAPRKTRTILGSTPTLLVLAVAFAGCSEQSSLALDEIHPQPGDRLFFDDFETRGSALWEPMVGSWSAHTMGGATTGYGPDHSTLSLTLAGSEQWTDYDVQAQVVLEDDVGKIGLLARVQSDHHYYELLLGKDEAGQRSWFIRRRNDHDWKTLASGRFDYQL